MIDVAIQAFIISLPVLIALDKGRLIFSLMLFVVVMAPIGVEVSFYAPEKSDWALFMAKLFCWFLACILAVRCNGNLTQQNVP